MNMHTSEALKEIQGRQPKKYELEMKIADLLSQYLPEKDGTEILSGTRIPELLCQVRELAGDTSCKIAELHAETIVLNRTHQYEEGVALLMQHHQERIAHTMGLSVNDKRYIQAA